MVLGSYCLFDYYIFHIVLHCVCHCEGHLVLGDTMPNDEKELLTQSGFEHMNTEHPESECFIAKAINTRSALLQRNAFEQDLNCEFSWAKNSQYCTPWHNVLSYA